MKSSLGGLLRRPDRSPSPSGFGSASQDERRDGGGAWSFASGSALRPNGSVADSFTNGNGTQHAYTNVLAAAPQPDAYTVALLGRVPSGPGPHKSDPVPSGSPSRGDIYMAAMGGDCWKAMNASRGGAARPLDQPEHPSSRTASWLLHFWVWCRAASGDSAACAAWRHRGLLLACAADGGGAAAAPGKVAELKPQELVVVDLVPSDRSFVASPRSGSVGAPPGHADPPRRRPGAAAA